MASAMPKVKAYPLCSECHTPYVLRLLYTLTPPAHETWLWQRDCKHKKAAPLASDSPALARLRAPEKDGGK